MYTLACKDAGMVNCGYIAKDETKDGAIKKGIEHVKKAHPEEMEKMKDMSEEQIMEKMGPLVKMA